MTAGPEHRFAPDQVMRRLAEATDPLLIGVRHHSAACAAAVRPILDRFRPDHVLVELPAEFAEWIPWLGHPEAAAPLALGAVAGGGVAFYPFADFSPELEVIRWAVQNGVPCDPFDLPMARRAEEDEAPSGLFGDEGEETPAGKPTRRVPGDPRGRDRQGGDPARGDSDGGGDPEGSELEGSDSEGGDPEGSDSEGDPHGGDPGGRASHPGAVEPHRIGRALLRRSGAEDHEALWDQLVEAPAIGADPEHTRRAALLYGWSLRADAGSAVRTSDLARERFMRERLAAARAAGRKRIVAVVGAFHGAALLDPDLDPLPRLGPSPKKSTGNARSAPAGAQPVQVVTSLLPYGSDQLDSRSGYPAGIRDPLWHQRVLLALREGRSIDDVAGQVLVEVCRRIRDERHVAGTPDAAEALRIAKGLAVLRDLPAPGRRELLEGVESALGHGEVMGRGRVVARALDRVLVGRTRGRLANGTPRSGLAPHVEALLAALKLPGPGDERPTEPIRLDPLRSETDRRRHVALRRLAAADIQYGELLSEELTSSWRVEWTAGTEATLAAAALRGVTLAQVAAGKLRADVAQLAAEDRLTAAGRIQALQVAAECGLPDLVTTWLGELRGPVVEEAGLRELVAAIRLVERVAHGHVPGSPVDPERVVKDEPGQVPNLVLPDGALPQVRDELLAAAVRAVDGLQGSDQLEDVAALVALVRVFELAPERLGDGRLGWALERLAEEGTGRMQGGAGGARVLLGTEPAEVLGERIGSWVDAAADAASRRMLAHRLQGALIAVGPHLEGHPGLLVPLMRRVAALDDDTFLARLPALRDGFDVLSPAARDRLLQAVSEHLPDDDGPLRAELDLDPTELAAFAEADLAGAETLRRLGLELPPVAPPVLGPSGSAARSSAPGAGPRPPGPPPATPTGPDAAGPGSADPDATAPAGPGGLSSPTPGPATLPVTPPTPGPAPDASPAGRPSAPTAVLPASDAAPAPDTGATTAGGPDDDLLLAPNPAHAVGGRDRWRLLLGRQRQRLPPTASRYARALDELYGQGKGEGAGGGVGRQGGDDPPFPTVRDWSEELAELFGGEVRQDVVGTAAERGDRNAVLELDPASVQPSVALLEQVLSLKGGLSEAQLDTLRRLVERVVRALVEELSQRIRPALTGLAVPRPTRRKTDRLDLRRTIAANLRTVRPRQDGVAGGTPILPERLVFRTRGRKSMDWRIVLVVDTSGSMDANVIHSAMMAAILSGLPAVALHFVAFSTEVVDLSERAADPLGLLLEVRVGGGTDIGKAVRYARGLVTAPTRTICVVVSDFEEGGPVGRLVSEVRTMVESGVKMLGLAALDDQARPNFNVAVAERLVSAGMPVAALTPLALARWVGEQIR